MEEDYKLQENKISSTKSLQGDMITEKTAKNWREKKRSTIDPNIYAYPLMKTKRNTQELRYCVM